MCGVDALERVNDFVTTVLNLFVPKMRDGGGGNYTVETCMKSIMEDPC